MCVMLGIRSTLIVGSLMHLDQYLQPNIVCVAPQRRDLEAPLKVSYSPMERAVKRSIQPRHI